MISLDKASGPPLVASCSFALFVLIPISSFVAILHLSSPKLYTILTLIPFAAPLQLLPLQLANTEEYIDGALAGNLGEVLIRCNNVLYIRGVEDEDDGGEMGQAE